MSDVDIHVVENVVEITPEEDPVEITAEHREVIIQPVPEDPDVSVVENVVEIIAEAHPVEICVTEKSVIIQMVTGAPGKDGKDGKDGRDGADGAPGADGKAATVSVGRVTTLPAGEDATVVNRGTETDALLDFGIPRGEKGESGGGGGGAWGEITGTLSDQTDLQAILDLKANLTSLAPKLPTSGWIPDGIYYDSRYDNFVIYRNGNIYSRMPLGTMLYYILNNKAETSDVYTKTQTNNLLADKADSDHTHDDRYYTESETDDLLANKSDTGHTHDDRYYTESETDALLATKSDTGHTHDGRYYTESETDTLLAGKANSSHTHDGRYYTETEVNNLLANKAAASHEHSADDITSGTLPFERGGTGAASRLAAAKNLTNENVGAAAQFFVTLTTSWGKFGYSSVANAWDALGGGAIGKKDALSASDITSGTLPLARGGTGGSDSGWVTLTSSYCTGNIYVRRIGEWIQITSGELNLKTALTAATGVTLLTLGANYRPGKMILFTAGCTFDTVYCRILAGGEVRIFKNRQSSSLPTTSTFYISAMYFAA